MYVQGSIFFFQRSSVVIFLGFFTIFILERFRIGGLATLAEFHPAIATIGHILKGCFYRLKFTDMHDVSRRMLMENSC